MIPVGLFSNMKSGKNKIDFERYGQNRRLNKLKKIVRDGDIGRVYVTGESGSDDFMSELEDRVIQFCKDKPAVVAIDGGDATVATVLTMIEKHWDGDELPLTAVLKGGTFVILAKRLGIKNSNKYLQHIVNSHDVNELSVEGLEMMRVRDDSDNEHLSFSAGVGLPVTMLEEVYKRKTLKNASVAIVAGRTWLSALIDGSYYRQFDNRHRMTVKAKGHVGDVEREGDWLMINAQSISSLGLPKFMGKPRVFEDAETEKRFHAIGSTTGLRKFIQYLPQIYIRDRSTYYDRETKETVPVLALDHQLKEMTILSDIPFNYQFNGELAIGPDPCVTHELYINAGRNVNFVRNYFRGGW